MRSLFSPAGLRALAQLPPESTLFAFDFDGTLAPIRDQAGKASIPKPLRSDFLKLNRRVPVAVVSGRGLKDLQARLKMKPGYLIGNHGLETPGLKVYREEAARLVREWKRQLQAQWSEFAGDPGVFIEDKSYSLSLHYRLSRQPRRSAKRLHSLARALKPRPRLIGGKDVWNLVPEGGPDKGKALVRLLEEKGYTHALYIGDDETDEDVFRQKRPGLLTIRVGRKAGSKAQFYVADERGVARLIRFLLQCTTKR